MPDQFADMDLSVTAYDANGAKLQNCGSESMPEEANGRYHLTADFSTNDPKKIVKVELRARPFEWVTFHGVPLYPGK